MKTRITPTLIILASLGLTSPVLANTITVSTVDDELNADGDCSLREAIQAANTNAAVDACAAGSGADTISIPDGEFHLTLGPAGEDANAGGDLDITESLTLAGTSLEGTIVDGQNADTILHMVAPGNLSLSNLSLIHGQSPIAGALFMNVDGDVAFDGVRIDSNLSGAAPAVLLSANNMNLTVTRSQFTGNSTILPSQGLALGYSSLVSGNLSLSDSFFSGNTSSTGAAGALFVQVAGNATLERVALTDNKVSFPASIGGGAYLSVAGNLSVTESEITGNTAGSGAAGLFISCGGNVDISKTLFENNQTTPAMFSQGGGLLLAAPTANLTETTIDGNRASLGAGMMFSGTTLTIDESTISRNITSGPLLSSGQGAGLNANGDVILRNATFSGNSTHGSLGQGGAILLNGVGASTATNVTMADNAASMGEAILATAGTITFTNTIIDDSCFGAAPGILLSGGNNIDHRNTCEFSTATNDLIDTDPLLGPLTNNGGSVETHALLEGSPAIDAGTETGAPAADARGFARPADGNNDGTAKTDIGALEVGCGDGVVQSFAGESCDDGNTDDSDACNNSCSSPSCGNGSVEGTEQCDNGAANSDTDADACRTDCKAATCGDGVTDTGEECDDGNTSSNDGCSDACQTEEEAPSSGGGCSLIR